MTGLRGFAHLQIDRSVIRRGKSGHFCDKALDGVSHHAIVPNVNVMDDLEVLITRLSDDEKRLFALICRSYLAAVMPDFEYRQTVVAIKVPVPRQGSGAAADARSGASPWCRAGRRPSVLRSRNQAVRKRKRLRPTRRCLGSSTARVQH